MRNVPCCALRARGCRCEGDSHLATKTTRPYSNSYRSQGVGPAGEVFFWAGELRSFFLLHRRWHQINNGNDISWILLHKNPYLINWHYYTTISAWMAKHTEIKHTNLTMIDCQSKLMNHKRRTEAIEIAIQHATVPCFSSPIIRQICHQPL